MCRFLVVERLLVLFGGLENGQEEEGMGGIILLTGEYFCSGVVAEKRRWCALLMVVDGSLLYQALGIV